MQIKFFKSKQNFLKKKSLQGKPDFFWKIILVLCFILLILSFILGLFTFKQIEKELDLSTKNSNGKVEITQKERIEKILEYFSNREKKSMEILDSTLLISDPSL